MCNGGGGGNRIISTNPLSSAQRSSRTYAQHGLQGMVNQHQQQSVDQYRQSVNDRYVADAAQARDAALQRLSETMAAARLTGGLYDQQRQQQINAAYDGMVGSEAYASQLDDAVSQYAARMAEMNSGYIPAQFVTGRNTLKSELVPRLRRSDEGHIGPLRVTKTGTSYNIDKQGLAAYLDESANGLAGGFGAEIAPEFNGSFDSYFNGDSYGDQAYTPSQVYSNVKHTPSSGPGVQSVTQLFKAQRSGGSSYGAGSGASKVVG